MNFPTQLIFRLHVIKRMFERDITELEIREVLDRGDIIKEYEDDKPYPSFLVFCELKLRPLHVVAAIDKEANRTIIITVYQPNIIEWEEGFKNRRNP